jgi:hypothetical protein
LPYQDIDQIRHKKFSYGSKRRCIFCSAKNFHIDQNGASFFAPQKTNPGALFDQYQDLKNKKRTGAFFSSSSSVPDAAQIRHLYLLLPFFSFFNSLCCSNGAYIYFASFFLS